MMFAIYEAYQAGLLKPKNWITNLIAGLIVGIVALPLAMAFAIASGVHPGPFSFEHIEAIDALVKNWHGQGNVDLPGFIQATRVDGSLRFVASKH